ncbi:MAG: hypothetical protein JWO94_1435 [Verrucomicrobiaceae bacterium]|nr:hypothetical protein [Verrucomicrobiaceae bacterium]
MRSLALPVFAILAFSTCGLAADTKPNPQLEATIAKTMVPYTGKSVPGIDPSTLTGKVMCGYQGWFNCEGDGANRSWVHWTKGKGIPSPANVKVDLWPDVSELGADEKFDTAFHHRDGSTAQVFSSYQKPTVLRHFQWMRDYGIDGVFVQRFVAGARSPSFQLHNNAVLANCREGANLHGRTYALMYDLSGLGADKIDEVMDDWRNLRTRMRLCDDPAYLHYKGKPVVAVWGIGFNDKRAYTLDDCRRLIEFLKKDGCTVMIGVPTYWREQKNDTVTDASLHDIMALADIISPWTVGRFGSVAQAAKHAEKVVRPDIAWCADHHLDYLPVLFPGFSWQNMYGSKNAIPRLKGEFMWAQFRALKQAGAGMLYVAMFDEVDEGTAIFKCTNDVPTESPFVTYEGLSPDYYLKLTGAGGKMLRGELPVESALPAP